MAILIGLGMLAYLAGFGGLWVFSLNRVDAWWGALLPIGWLILVPCFLIQFFILGR
jgi:hypothetical protein